MLRLALVAAAAALLVLAGCGGGGERLTQAQFDAKVRAVCAGYTKRAERELKRLTPPAASARRYAQVLAVYRRIEDALVRTARAARRGDRRGIEAVEIELTELDRQDDVLRLPCA